MKNIKKKVNVIRPTLRHKKVYFKISFSKKIDDVKKIKNLFFKSYEKTNGIFSQINGNLSILEINSKEGEIILRVNQLYKDDFLSSLFFFKKEFGTIIVLDEKKTIKSLKLK